LDDKKEIDEKPSESVKEKPVNEAINIDKPEQISVQLNENTIPSEIVKSSEDHERKESLEMKQDAASDNSESDSEGGEDDQETLSNNHLKNSFFFQRNFQKNLTYIDSI
jgi:hypothetical protein